MLINYKDKLKEYRFKSLIGECTKKNRRMILKLDQWYLQEINCIRSVVK